MGLLEAWVEKNFRNPYEAVLITCAASDAVHFEAWKFDGASLHAPAMQRTGLVVQLVEPFFSNGGIRMSRTVGYFMDPDEQPLIVRQAADITPWQPQLSTDTDIYVHGEMALSVSSHGPVQPIIDEQRLPLSYQITIPPAPLYTLRELHGKLVPIRDKDVRMLYLGITITPR